MIDRRGGQTVSQRSGALDVHGLVEALPVAALVLGLDDRLLEANARAQALFHFGSTNGRFQDLELSRIPQLRQALELAKRAARRIRRRLGDSVRLVALSGYGDDEARRRGREAGFDTHLVKPVAPEDLTRAIGSL